MEEFGGAAAARSRNHRNGSPSDRLLGVFIQHPAAPALELSEQDIFNTPSGSSPPSPTHSGSPNRTRSLHNHNHPRNQYGILAALNDNLKTRSGSDNRPVFNHKASALVSLSSSSSTSPAASSSSRMAIPRKPPPPPQVERMRMRLRHQSAPVNVPQRNDAAAARGGGGAGFADAGELGAGRGWADA
ncbi:hypothetical protein SASPL_100979 [Salvia splendens]|uniref:Uncharacterized protein n=1 Tax=Salvia splendens TaxID=180675 RepID=A0A8X9AAT2_SALSN|nr:hypothetical protein SASPL_100979 [Salvia splendens]